MHSTKEVQRLMEMEKQISKLTRAVMDNNYMMMQTSDNEDTIRSQVVAVSNFNAFIHKGCLNQKEKEIIYA